MSLIVAIKDNDRIVLGADKQVSTGSNKDHTCTKIWKVEELPGAIMGGVGSARGNQVIQFSQILDKNVLDTEKDLDISFIVNHLVPSLVGTLKTSGVPCTDPEKDGVLVLPNSFLFAYKSSAWMIWHDLSVVEISEYLAIGSGSDVATGVLFATRDKDPFERIVTCIDAAAESTLYVDNGVDILVTANKPQDLSQIRKALADPAIEESAEYKKVLDDIQFEYEAGFGNKTETSAETSAKKKKTPKSKKSEK